MTKFTGLQDSQLMTRVHSILYPVILVIMSVRFWHILETPIPSVRSIENQLATIVTPPPTITTTTTTTTITAQQYRGQIILTIIL